jgi:site-specific DNA-methyltransferase (adenine-specific)
MVDLPNECIDLTVTSPPYDNLRKYNGYSWDFETVAKQLFRITKKGGVVVWIVNDATINGSETGTSFKQALYFKECGFNLHDTMIWEKPSFTATGSLSVRYAPVFEYMFVFSKGKPKTFNPIKDKPNIHAGTKLHGTLRQKDGSTRCVSTLGKPVAKHGQRHNVWKMAGEMSSKNRFHPAMFPEQLASDHIISWSNPGDLVLDPFMGSGTTAKAALLHDRNFIGFEISKEYCEIANERLRGFYCDRK